jgi:opacity protein-like surface antigen
MKSFIFLAVSACVLAAGAFAATAEESSPQEIIRHISPNKKFAMRIVCHYAPADPENIDADAVKGVELVSLPEKQVVATLPFGGYDGFKLIWAGDSKWCAFYSRPGRGKAKPVSFA